ncbi:proto-oncogene Mas-like isoform X2 [Protopterus annectens]|nr:proto-oncogene Mas-like isoform X2 [Protopterus annectens]
MCINSTISAQTRTLPYTENEPESQCPTPNSSNCSKPYDYSFWWLTLGFSFFGIPGNGIVIWFLIFRIRRYSYTIYVLNLAVADFFYLVARCLSSIVRLSVENPDAKCFYNLIMSILIGWQYETTLLVITVISIDRCASVLRPVWYRYHRSKKVALKVCCALWVLALANSTVRNALKYVYKTLKKNNPQSHDGHQLFVTIGLVMIYTVLVPVLCICTLLIICKIKKNSSLYSAVINKALIASLVAFLVFSAPLKISIYLKYHFSCNNYLFTGFAEFLGKLLAVIGSSINPLIYFFIGTDLRKKFKESLLSILQKVFEEELSETVNRRKSRSTTVMENTI